MANLKDCPLLPIAAERRVTYLKADQLNPQQAISLSDLYSVPAFREAHPYLFKSKGELDYLLRNRDFNGLSACGAVVASRTGRRLTIVAPLFVAWLLGETEVADGTQK